MTPWLFSLGKILVIFTCIVFWIDLFRRLK